MKRLLELNLGALFLLLAVAVGCGGNTSDPSSGGASSSAGSPGTSNGGAAHGGAPATPGGGAHASAGQTSNPGTAGGFMTSLPGTTLLTDLTPEQATQLCTEAGKYLTPLVSVPLAAFQCKAHALSAAAQATTDAAAQSACSTALGSCVPAAPDSGASMCSSTTPATCMATVADFAICLDDTSGALISLSDSVPSCIGMTLAQAQAALVALAAANAGGLAEPASCSKYDASCGSMTGTP